MNKDEPLGDSLICWTVASSSAMRFCNSLCLLPVSLYSQLSSLPADLHMPQNGRNPSHFLSIVRQTRPVLNEDHLFLRPDTTVGLFSTLYVIHVQQRTGNADMQTLFGEGGLKVGQLLMLHRHTAYFHSFLTLHMAHRSAGNCHISGRRTHSQHDDRSFNVVY